MSKKATKLVKLQQDKAIVLQKIAQQRNEYLKLEDEWLQLSAPIDKFWLHCYHYRKAIVLSVASLTLFVLKRPMRLIKLTKTAIKFWGTTKIVSRLLFAINRKH